MCHLLKVLLAYIHSYGKRFTIAKKAEQWLLVMHDKLGKLGTESVMVKTERGERTARHKQNKKENENDAALELCSLQVGIYRQKPSLPHLVWDVLVLLQEHFELADADVQVPIGELIGNIKAQWAKLPSLQSNSMEKAQRQEQRLEV